MGPPHKGRDLLTTFVTTHGALLQTAGSRRQLELIHAAKLDEQLRLHPGGARPGPEAPGAGGPICLFPRPGARERPATIS